MQSKRYRAIWIAASLLAIASFSACQKDFVMEKSDKAVTPDSTSLPPFSDYMRYTIPAAAQYSGQEHFETISTSKLAFTVQFDSSAVYTTKDPGNQADINKLYGFSDNRKHHHEFSARFGWRWYNKILSLHGYIYNDGVREYKELGSIAIGKPAHCAIVVERNQYSFILNGDSTTMRRTSKTVTAEGYRLYPYFGGDEFAPHAITILIKEQ